MRRERAEKASSRPGGDRLRSAPAGLCWACVLVLASGVLAPGWTQAAQAQSSLIRPPQLAPAGDAGGAVPPLRLGPMPAAPRLPPAQPPGAVNPPHPPIVVPPGLTSGPGVAIVAETVPPEVAAALTSMAAQAAVIFAGQVRTIDREDARGYVDIGFSVDRVVRGTAASVFVLREWSGLWTWQQDRYQIGARLLLLLRARSGSGFSTPVGGLDGAIPLRGGVQPPIRSAAGLVAPDRGGPLLTGESAPALDLTRTRADLRWIAARARRAQAGSPVAAQSTRPIVPSPRLLAGPDAAAPMPAGADQGSDPGPIAPLGSGSAAGFDGTAKPGVAVSAVLALLESIPEAGSRVQ